MLSFTRWEARKHDPRKPAVSASTITITTSSDPSDIPHLRKRMKGSRTSIAEPFNAMGSTTQRFFVLAYGPRHTTWWGTMACDTWISNVRKKTLQGHSHFEEVWQQSVPMQPESDQKATFPFLGQWNVWHRLSTASACKRPNTRSWMAFEWLGEHFLIVRAHRYSIWIIYHYQIMKRFLHCCVSLRTWLRVYIFHVESLIVPSETVVLTSHCKGSTILFVWSSCSYIYKTII